MGRRHVEVGFRAAAPQENAALEDVLCLESQDILLDLFREIEEVAAMFVERDIRSTVEPRVEDPRPGPDRGQLMGQAVDQVDFEGTGEPCRRVSVGRDDIPGAERQIVKVLRPRQVQVVADPEMPGLLLASDVDGPEQGERAHRLGETLLYRLDSCYEGRADGAQSAQQYPDSLRTGVRSRGDPRRWRGHGVISVWLLADRCPLVWQIP